MFGKTLNNQFGKMFGGMFVGFTGPSIALPPSFPDDPTNPSELLTLLPGTTKDGIRMDEVVGLTTPPPYSEYNGRGRAWNFDGDSYILVGDYTAVFSTNILCDLYVGTVTADIAIIAVLVRGASGSGSTGIYQNGLNRLTAQVRTVNDTAFLLNYYAYSNGLNRIRMIVNGLNFSLEVNDVIVDTIILDSPPATTFTDMYFGASTGGSSKSTCTMWGLCLGNESFPAIGGLGSTIIGDQGTLGTLTTPTEALFYVEKTDGTGDDPSAIGFHWYENLVTWSSTLTKWVIVDASVEDDNMTVHLSADAGSGINTPVLHTPGDSLTATATVQGEVGEEVRIHWAGDNVFDTFVLDGTLQKIESTKTLTVLDNVGIRNNWGGVAHTLTVSDFWVRKTNRVAPYIETFDTQFSGDILYPYASKPYIPSSDPIKIGISADLHDDHGDKLTVLDTILDAHEALGVDLDLFLGDMIDDSADRADSQSQIAGFASTIGARNVKWIVGNHDLQGTSYDDFVTDCPFFDGNFTYDVGGWRIIGFEAVREGYFAASDETLAWLTSELSNTEGKNVIIATHPRVDQNYAGDPINFTTPVAPRTGSVTASATTGTGVTLTSSDSSFVADDVSSWNKLAILHGTTYGLCKVISFIDSSTLIVDIEQDFAFTTASDEWGAAGYSEVSYNANEIRPIIEASTAKIKAVINGHGHRNYDNLVKGIKYIEFATSSVGANAVLNLYPDGYLSVDGFGNTSYDADMVEIPKNYPAPLQQPARIVDVPCADVSLTDTFAPSEPVTVISTEGTAVMSSDGTTITTAGLLYTITLSNGEILDVAEGSGSNLHSRTGNTTFAITTASEALFWSGIRPEGSIDPRALYGFWQISGDDVFYPFPITTSTKGNIWDAVTLKAMETVSMINADKLQDLAGTGPYRFGASGLAVAYTLASSDTDGVANYNKQLYMTYCKGEAQYTVQLTDGQDAEAMPWFFCDSLAGCDAALTIGTLSGTLKPSYFDGGVIDTFTWEVTGNTITVAMETGFTPTEQYLRLIVGGLETTLAFEAVSESFIATGSHTAEDLAIVNYLVANTGEVTCVRMLGKPYSSPLLDFSSQDNSQYIPLIF